jgi:acyl-CoA synthetase (NDP forming)
LVISTSGGAGTVAVDEAESLGLTLAEIPPEMVQELIKLELSPLAKIQNPLDLASITAEHFRKVALLADNFNTADVILISFGDPVRGGSEVIQELAKVLNSSLAVSYFGGGEMETRDRFLIQRAGIPVFASPDRAVRGIAAAVWKAEFCRTRGGG